MLSLGLLVFRGEAPGEAQVRLTYRLHPTLALLDGRPRFNCSIHKTDLAESVLSGDTNRYGAPGTLTVYSVLCECFPSIRTARRVGIVLKI